MKIIWALFAANYIVQDDGASTIWKPYETITSPEFPFDFRLRLLIRYDAEPRDVLEQYVTIDTTTSYVDGEHIAEGRYDIPVPQHPQVIFPAKANGPGDARTSRARSATHANGLSRVILAYLARTPSRCAGLFLVRRVGGAGVNVGA